MTNPSYIAKLARAKEHLIDLENAVEAFVNTHPYTVRQRVEGKKEKRTHRIEFTASPADTRIAVIAADAINNLRFSLDHLMCALVPRKERSGVMFPIYFDGVWEPSVPGENEQRIKERGRWAAAVKSLSNDAIAVLKKCQPADRAPNDPQTHLLRLINSWSNRDRHERLPLVVQGLTDVTAKVIHADGRGSEGMITAGGGGDSFPNDANLGVPEDAVDVQIHGVTVVAIRWGDEGSYFRIPKHLLGAATLIEKEIVPELAPFVRADAS